MNRHLRGFRAYIGWLQAEGHFKEAFKARYFLKAEQKVVATLSPEQITKLVAFKPKGD
jgi:hypothetical protein